MAIKLQAQNGGEEPPKIEFPCDYPIKVLGESAPDFEELAVAVICRHAELASSREASVKERASSKGRFTSVTVTITATGEQQLKDIFEALKATGRVKMVI